MRRITSREFWRNGPKLVLECVNEEIEVVNRGEVAFYVRGIGCQTNGVCQTKFEENDVCQTKKDSLSDKDESCQTSCQTSYEERLEVARKALKEAEERTIKKSENIEEFEVIPEIKYAWNGELGEYVGMTYEEVLRNVGAKHIKAAWEGMDDMPRV